MKKTISCCFHKTTKS